MAKRHPASSSVRRSTAPIPFVGRFLRNGDRRATVPEIRKIGDVAPLRYALSLRLLDA